MRWKLAMSKFRARARANRFQVWLLIAGVCLASAGCRRDMQDQPKMKPFRGTAFFGDGLSGRQPIQGTIARGFLRDNAEYFTGKKSVKSATPPTGSATAPTGTENAFADDIETF